MMQESLPTLKNYSFYISSEFADILFGLEFKPNETKFGITEVTDDEGNTSEYIIFTDGKLTISSRPMQNDNLPVEICKEYWNVPFNTKIVLNTQKVYKVLSRVAPFIDGRGDKEYVSFNINGDSLQVVSLNGQGRDRVNDVSNIEQYTNTIQLPVLKMLSLLSVVKTPTFDLSVNTDKDNCVCVDFSGYKCIVSAGDV